MKREDKLARFVSKATHVHGGAYSYARAVYTDSYTPVIITCPKHGDFTQPPHSHLRGSSGCPSCAADKMRVPFSEFTARAMAVHGGRYAYHEDSYTMVSSRTRITCAVHGDFIQPAALHLKGHNCPQCAASARATSNTKDTAWFSERARRVHGDTYDYSNTKYVSNNNVIIVRCRTHGEFAQRAVNHLAGHGCPQCGAGVTASVTDARRDSAASFVRKAVRVHGDLYDYSAVAYVNSTTPVTIKCSKHGSFEQQPNKHIQGQGCPKCAHTASRPEMDILTLCPPDAIHRHKPAWLGGMELDIYIPSRNLAIEYCGSHVHNSTRNVFGGSVKDRNYHYDKWKLCRDNGVTLMTIHDFEWLTKREQWEKLIAHKLHKAERRVYARKCVITPMAKPVAWQFMKDHHIEGTGKGWSTAATILGLEHEGELVAVMVEDKGNIERSCTLAGVSVVGGVSKLFKAMPAGSIMMTTNNTGSSGNYGTLLNKHTLRYWWVHPSSLAAHPRRQCQKQFLEAKFGEPLNGRSERQYMEDLGYTRVYDSGLSYWTNV